MKKIFSSFVLAFLLCLFVSGGNISANFNEEEIPTVSSSGSLLVENILERATFWGNGGSVTLDYMSSGGYVAWKINPNTPYSYVFSGSLEIRLASNNSLKKSIPIAASGTGSKSGTVEVYYLGLKKGTRYKAILKGALTATAGTTMLIDDSVQIEFTY